MYSIELIMQMQVATPFFLLLNCKYLIFSSVKPLNKTQRNIHFTPIRAEYSFGNIKTRCSSWWNIIGNIKGEWFDVTRHLNLMANSALLLPSTASFCGVSVIWKICWKFVLQNHTGIFEMKTLFPWTKLLALQSFFLKAFHSWNPH